MAIAPRDSAKTAATVATGLAAGVSFPSSRKTVRRQQILQPKLPFSKEHLTAVNRRRRVVVNYDNNWTSIRARHGTDMDCVQPLTKPLFKTVHPEWLLHTWEDSENPGYWNFAVKEVRDYKVSILREVAENYDYDGIDVDFSRVTVDLPLGHQWENREHLTEFMRAVRVMTLEVEQRRGRPLLLSARITESIVGCHFDGMDVETWAREQLVDIFVLGDRSFEVDLPGFRRITAGTEIKLYPCLDDHHASDGYEHPPIEVFRGVAANWWSQGADGIQTMNFADWTAVLDNRDPFWPVHRQVYREIGSPETLKSKDKSFVVQRRGGGCGPTVVPNPTDWTTPRWMCSLSNMFSQLPANLANDGKADTLLFVYVADDMSRETSRVDQIEIRVLLSDPEAKDLPASKRLEEVIMNCRGQVTTGGKLPNLPPAKGITKLIELRLNNIFLGEPSVKCGWLVFKANPNQFAVGKNLVGLRVTQRPPDARREIQVEMLEVHVRYR